MLQCYVLMCARSVTAFLAPPRSQRPGQGPRSPHPKAGPVWVECGGARLWYVKTGKGYEKGRQYPCQGSQRVPRKYTYETYRLTLSVSIPLMYLVY
jgi:hypothetical protein